MKTELKKEIKRREGMIGQWGLQTVLDLQQLLRSLDTGTCSPCVRGLDWCYCCLRGSVPVTATAAVRVRRLASALGSLTRQRNEKN